MASPINYEIALLLGLLSNLHVHKIFSDGLLLNGLWQIKGALRVLLACCCADC